MTLNQPFEERWSAQRSACLAADFFRVLLNLQALGCVVVVHGSFTAASMCVQQQIHRCFRPFSSCDQEGPCLLSASPTPDATLFDVVVWFSVKTHGLYGIRLVSGVLTIAPVGEELPLGQALAAMDHGGPFPEVR